MINPGPFGSGFVLSLCKFREQSGKGEEVGVGQADAVGEFGGVGPAEASGLADVEEFAGGAVGAGCVPSDFARVAYGGGYEFCQLLDCELFAGSGIDGFGVRVVVHQEDAELSEVVDIKELAQRRAVAPASDAFRT